MEHMVQISEFGSIYFHSYTIWTLEFLSNPKINFKQVNFIYCYIFFSGTFHTMRYLKYKFHNYVFHNYI